MNYLREERKDIDVNNLDLFDLTTTRERTNFQYDDLGRMDAYNELSSTVLAMIQNTPWEIQQNTRWSGTVNNLGQVVTFSEYAETTGFGILSTRQSDRQNVLYDKNNRLTSYTQVVKTNDAPDLTVETIWQATGFDRFGRTDGFTATDEKRSGNRILETSQRERTGVVYDGQDRYISYDDIENDTDRPDLRVKTQFSGANYDGHGLLASSTEVKHQWDVTGGFMDQTEKTSNIRTYD